MVGSVRMLCPTGHSRNDASSNVLAKPVKSPAIVLVSHYNFNGFLLRPGMAPAREELKSISSFRLIGLIKEIAHSLKSSLFWRL